MKTLIRQISYLVFGTLALISAFLGFSVVKAVAIGDSAMAVGTAKGVNEALAQNGGGNITFFEYIGDFCRDMKATTGIAAFFAFIAILAVAIMMFIAVMSLVKKDVNFLDEMHIKWIAVAAFASCLIALLIAVICPDLPAATELIKYKASIGVGSILFLVGTALAAIFSFVHPFILKEDK